MSTGDILVGTNTEMTVAEAAKADDAVILTDSDADSEDERTNRSLTIFTGESDP